MVGALAAVAAAMTNGKDIWKGSNKYDGCGPAQVLAPAVGHVFCYFRQTCWVRALLHPHSSTCFGVKERFKMDKFL